MWWDWNYPLHPMDKDKRKYMKLCKTLNAEQRNPYPYEWDWIIEYSYPEEDRILDRLDNPDNPKQKNDVKKIDVYNYTLIHMEDGTSEDVYIQVPLHEKEDYT